MEFSCPSSHLPRGTGLHEPDQLNAHRGKKPTRPEDEGSAGGAVLVMCSLGCEIRVVWARGPFRLATERVFENQAQRSRYLDGSHRPDKKSRIPHLAAAAATEPSPQLVLDPAPSPLGHLLQ